MTNKVFRRRLKMLEKKSPDTSGLVKKIDYKTNATQFGNRMSIVTVLVTTAVLNATSTKVETKTSSS